MKLISCYIENFGGLSQYRLRFDEGLTVIQEHNGFGKTTLAEFLRAMFYGFPKATSKSLGKRKKYTPWNGGKFGGTLDFEYEGECYRIQRSFGSVPSRDKFSLIDLSTNRESTRFSQQIGLELFQLDAESFERSTYMPQLHDASSLTTNTIQAKLGDLVEDTNDINNFDKAIEALKSKRSSFVPYRGNGGAVAEANREISRLQNELALADGKHQELDAVCQRINHENAALAEKKQELEQIRGRITAVSQAAARKELQKQYRQKQKEYNEILEYTEQLRTKFPASIPQQQDVEALEQAVEQLAILEGQEMTTQADLDAQQFLQENQARFADGIPADGALEDVRQQFEAYQSLRTRHNAAGMSPTEQEQLDALHTFFAAGVPDEEQLEELEHHHLQVLQLESVLGSQTMEQEELRRLEELERRFGADVPTKEAIQEQRQVLRQADAVREENRKLTENPAPIQQFSERPKKKSGAVIALLILGALGAAAGVGLLIGKSYVIGGVVLALGVAAILGGSAIGIRNMIDNRISVAAPVSYGLRPETQEQIRSNEEKIRQLEDTVRMFTAAFTPTVSLVEALAEIENMAQTYQSLRSRKRAADEKRRELSAEMERHRTALEEGLRPYFSGPMCFDHQIGELRLKCSQYQSLTAAKAEAERGMIQLSERIAQQERQLTAFFTPYFGEVSPEQFGSLLTKLHSLRDEFVRAQQQVQQWKSKMEAVEAQCGHWHSVQDKFAATYDLRISSREEVRTLRDVMREHENAHRRCEVLYQQNRAFEEEHQDALGAEDAETADIQQLKILEHSLTDEMGQISDLLLRAQQKRDFLQDEIQKIPGMQDELQLWKEKKQEGQTSSDLLDDTMTFLQMAKDQLAGSYLGGIQSSFANLMNRLMDENREQILVTPELEVRLERLGEARDLAYFSAGQTDMIMLCMRLALVDALFGEVKPFVILDDPFVNLDDEGTRKALKLLRELAQDRQIIYMVCNSSRV